MANAPSEADAVPEAIDDAVEPFAHYEIVAAAA